MTEDKTTHEFIVSGINEPMKIRDYLTKRLGFSTSLIARVKYEGVFLSGTQVHMRAMVRCGDEIRIIMPKEKGSDIKPIDIPLNILFEDNDILAVDKPTGMPTHPSRGNSLPTLAEAVVNYLGADTVFRAVSRLDKDTSGIVLIAKNAYSAAVLGRAMKNGLISKEYTAIITGVPSERCGIIDAPIERIAEGDIRRCVREGGKAAQTEYTVVGKTAGGNSIVKIKLHTGRTHQIRVHMAHIGHPVLGDPVYGRPTQFEKKHPALFAGQCLHAGELTFVHPRTKEKVTVSAPLPANFERILELLRYKD